MKWKSQDGNVNDEIIRRHRIVLPHSIVEMIRNFLANNINIHILALIHSFIHRWRGSNKQRVKSVHMHNYLNRYSINNSNRKLLTSTFKQQSKSYREREWERPIRYRAERRTGECFKQTRIYEIIIINGFTQN